jgi:hypothetical protein
MDKSVVLKFSMNGYENPILTFATRGTSTGFNTHQWAWSTDNVTYTNFGTNTANTTSTFLLRTLDLGSIDALIRHRRYTSGLLLPELLQPQATTGLIT